MCGFVAVLSRHRRAPDRAMVERMSATIAHRGPDDSGTWFDGPIGIGFRRLSILDLSPCGHQPMVSADGNCVIAYNGEVFNYVELREELRALGHTFHSTGDTEVLLEAWREWGPDCLERLNGMFAFVVWDRARGTLFGARDRYGIKPFYVHTGPEAILVASEIKAIGASGLSPLGENWSSLADYLLHGRLDVSGRTTFDGIEQLPPGHLLWASADEGVRQQRYYSIATPVRPRADEAPERIGELFRDSVGLRMRSDVPVGVCLSGGLDSTSIICEMARRRGDGAPPLLAFSYNAPEFDESAYVAETVRATGATLVSLATEPRRLWDLLPTLLRFHDEPLHSMNAPIGYQLMELARQHGVIVLLNGQGADETQAGYSNYFFQHWHSLVAGGRIRRAREEIRDYADAVGADAAGLWARVLRTAAFRGLQRVPGYASAARRARRSRSRHDPWFTEDLTRRAPERGPVRQHLDDAQRQDVTEWPLPLYLRIEDRNAMAHGVEARLPFLDYRLVDYAMTLPEEWRIRGPWGKVALRDGMRDRIPESVRTRVDKLGFPTPAGKWFANELYEPVRDLLGSRAARERGIYRTDRLLQSLDAARGGELPDYLPAFRAVNVELWFAMLAERRTELRRTA